MPPIHPQVLNDTLLPEIANTLRSKTVNTELSKEERLGSLALAIFSHMARARVRGTGAARWLERLDRCRL